MASPQRTINRQIQKKREKKEIGEEICITRVAKCGCKDVDRLQMSG